MADRTDGLIAARDAVLAEAEAFRGELGPLLARCLEAGVERVCAVQAAHLATMDRPTEEAFYAAATGAVRAGVEAATARLRDPDVWLSPLVAPDLPPRRHWGWPAWLPEWVARLLGGSGRERVELGGLDDPSNRIWIAIAAATGPVDAVLREFGFEPGRPRIGAGRFGVGPRALPRLDPTGVLARRWRRYRAALERYEALARIRD